MNQVRCTTQCILNVANANQFEYFTRMRFTIQHILLEKAARVLRLDDAVQQGWGLCHFLHIYIHFLIVFYFILFCFNS